MGNELGKCCASEEIEEVIKRDGTQTLSFDNDKPSQQTPASNGAPELRGEPITNRWGTFYQRTYNPDDLPVLIRLQATFRGILTRKMIRQKLTDMTLNSITQSFANVSVITGGTMAERKPDPVKKYVLADGALYSGQVRRDAVRPDELIPDGKGKLKWPNGDKFSGRFVGGVPNGEGIKQIVATGITIQGTFTQGMAQGQGKMTRENAGRVLEYCYEGGLLFDRQDGYGIETTADGAKYEGYFKKGKKGPSGTWHLTNGNMYQGEFLNGVMHGHGKLTNSINKTSYEGDWKSGKMHGQGLYLWEDGRRYQGQYENDKKKGFGAYMWVDGRVYHGMWKDGVQNGEGTTVNPNMLMKKAFWENGKETTQLELAQAEREEIEEYVQNMHKEKARLMAEGKIKATRTSVANSRTKKLQSAARTSMNAASLANRRSSSQLQ